MDQENIKEIIQEELKDAAQTGTQVSIPLYERFKGKQAHGSKTWRVSEKENRTVWILAIVFVAMVILAFVVSMLPIPTGYKVLIDFLAIFSGVGGMGGYLFYVAYRHHKEDPVEMHYYDVNYEQNYITGNGYDNTREISKEEFFGKTTDE